MELPPPSPLSSQARPVLALLSLTNFSSEKLEKNVLPLDQMHALQTAARKIVNTIGTLFICCCVGKKKSTSLLIRTRINQSISRCDASYTLSEPPPQDLSDWIK